MCIKIAKVGAFDKESGISFTNVGKKELDSIAGATRKILDMTVDASSISQRWRQPGYSHWRK